MARNRWFLPRLACAALGLALWAIPHAALSDTVGTAAAVKPSSTGTPPGGSARTLTVGTGIVERERIQTTGSGSLQVMFNDKSTLTVGPGSDLVIDQFVYNPGSGGDMLIFCVNRSRLANEASVFPPRQMWLSFEFAPRLLASNVVSPMAS